MRLLTTLEELWSGQLKKVSKKVAVGLSGGVDSSVSAYLLKKQGYEVTGVYMQCWDSKADGCRAEEDRADAVKAASHIGIPFLTLDFRAEYKQKVIEYFYKSYEEGLTPNPDILCNKEIKFGLFMDWAIKEGFDFVATGHYARIKNNTLMRGIDNTKDQSYFLYLLNKEQLKKIIFPLGEMRKIEVRKIAKKVGLQNFNKPDSMGICFIGEVDIKDFLSKKLPIKVGNVVDKNGEIIGTHDGVYFYTIGQRHGFKITKYYGLPLYVIGKNMEKNELIVGFGKDGLRRNFEVSDLHWIEKMPSGKINCDVRIRHLGALNKASLTEDGKGTYTVETREPLLGVAAGQGAVFYDSKDVVLGGGIIL